MTTQQLQDRHDKGERILDVIKQAERKLLITKYSYEVQKRNNMFSFKYRNRLEYDIELLKKAIPRLKHYYFSTMEIVPTESIQEIAKEVAKGTEFYADSTSQIETFESDDYRLEFEFTSYYLKGDFEEIADLNIYELFHDRKKYTAEEIDGLKLLLLEELTKKGIG